MATDQRTSTVEAGTEPGGPVIENELPTYRAISKQAIFSVACGAISICSFAHPAFYALALLAVGLGILAQRAIRRYPEMLTGRALANAGITMGLIFGLISGTVTSVQYLVRKRQAEEYAKKYTDVLKSRNLGEILWYNTHPDARKNKTPEELVQESTNKPKQQQMMEANMGPLVAIERLRKRLAASKSETIEFVKIEGVGEEEGHGLELQIYALALYKVEGPGNAEFPDKTQYALAILKARPMGRVYEWWTQSINFPYEPQSFKPPEASVGDGHDHGGAGH